MPLVLSEKWVDRSHKVDAEYWGDEVRYYPTHHVFLIGWQYYPNHHSDDGRVHFMYEDTAVRHLEALVARGR